MLPEAIGPYRVTGTLGRGGMGVVLRGQGPDGRVAVSPDGRLALSTAHDRTARLWRLPDGGAVDVVSLASSHEAPLGATFTPDGAGLLLSTTRGAVLRFALR